MILWILWVVLVLVLLVLLAAYVCYRIAFYVPPRKEKTGNEIDVPVGEIYEVYREPMEKWAKEVRAMPHEVFSVQSFDGLTLYGK